MKSVCSKIFHSSEVFLTFGILPMAPQWDPNGHRPWHQVDLTFQNTAALVNTELLKAYSKMCPQLRDLGIAVKRWAKAVACCALCVGNVWVG